MDIILEKFFAPERWEYAIEKGVGKDIRKADLIRLTEPDTRIALYRAMRDGQYEIAPPHTALIPKDTPGEFRTVYVNEPTDRVVLSIANDLLFDLMPEMVHRNCKSYLRGVGCADVVMECSKTMQGLVGKHCKRIGFKSDLSKYFDRVPIEYIDRAFDRVEEKYGHSALIDVLRKYYHSDWYFDTDGNLCQQYQSLKQGCSVASWLADVILYDVDEIMSQRAWYKRYSDDMLCLSEHPEDDLAVLKSELEKMGMSLNPKKVELLDGKHWFKFLGFSLKGGKRSLSSTRIKTFQKEIESRTIRKTKKKNNINIDGVIRSVMRYLYVGDGRHSWATGVLRVINVKDDLEAMNNFVMDAIRATITGNKSIGGLGYVSGGTEGCIARGKGRHVKANRQKTGDDIGGYLSLGCMRKALLTSRAAFDTMARCGA